MKTIIILIVLVVQTILGEAQVAQKQNSLIWIPMACFHDQFGNLNYSQEETDRLITSYIPGALMIRGSKIVYSEKDGFLLTAMIELEDGWGNVAIIMEKSGRMLCITENSCAHICLSDPKNPCKIISELKGIIACKEVYCECLVSGSTRSKIIIGDLTKLKSLTRTIEESSLCN